MKVRGAALGLSVPRHRMSTEEAHRTPGNILTPLMLSGFLKYRHSLLN